MPLYILHLRFGRISIIIIIIIIIIILLASFSYQFKRMVFCWGLSDSELLQDYSVYSGRP